MTRERRRLLVERLEDRRLLAVVINELHYNPDDNTSREEFIELYNTGPTAVDLSGWSFTDGVSYTFPQGSQIAAGGYVVIAEHPPTLWNNFGVVAMGPFSGGLSGDGENVELRNAQGQLIDEVDYNVSFPWPIAIGGDGQWRVDGIDPPLVGQQLGQFMAGFLHGADVPHPIGSGAHGRGIARGSCSSLEL